jgi:hypothetical protein
VSASDLSPLNAPPLPDVSAAPVGPSWQEQDGVLRDMWLKNQTPNAIAEALNRSIPAIMTRAARLGLPRRSAPGRKPGRRMLDENGTPIQSTTRTTHARTGMQPAAAPQTSLRTCLMCLGKFESLGRHNRICSSCKGSSEYETASALSDIHLPSS